MTIDFLKVMNQGCNLQVLVSNEVPDNLATPIIYFTEAKTNGMLLFLLLLFLSKLFILFIYFYLWSHSMWDLRFLTREATCAHCNRGMVSEPLDFQGSS